MEVAGGDYPRIRPAAKGKNTQPVKAREQATYFMERVRQGDEQAFEQLQQYYVSHVAAFVRKRHKNSADVDDMTQEVFLRVWKKREDYRPWTPDWPYLKGFARYVFWNHQDNPTCKLNVDHEYDLGLEIDPNQASPLEQAGIKEQAQALLDLITKLPGKQRCAVEQVYVNGLLSREASEKLGCSEHTIRVHCRLGLMKLKAWMEEAK